MMPRGVQAPNLSKAAKAVVAAAVPVAIAGLLWIQSGALDEAAMSVALTGLLTALFVFFVPNSGLEERERGE